MNQRRTARVSTGGQSLLDGVEERLDVLSRAGRGVRVFRRGGAGRPRSTVLAAERAGVLLGLGRWSVPFLERKIERRSVLALAGTNERSDQRTRVRCCFSSPSLSSECRSGMWIDIALGRPLPIPLYRGPEDDLTDSSNATLACVFLGVSWRRPSSFAREPGLRRPESEKREAVRARWDIFLGLAPRGDGCLMA